MNKKEYQKMYRELHKEDIIKLCHYTNLQLLKSIDNLKKSAKVESNFGNCGFLVE